MQLWIWTYGCGRQDGPVPLIQYVVVPGACPQAWPRGRALVKTYTDPRLYFSSGAFLFVWPSIKDHSAPRDPSGGNSP